MSESGGNERVVVDPITRIEGHLRIEAQMDGDKIEKAYSSGTMVRGIETILKGRDPRDAWAYAQRICGVCTLVHGLASIRSVENALDYKIPKNADLIRNLMNGAQYIHDHVMHFYHLHALDWVDVVSALDADPAATSELAQSLSSYPKSSPGYFSDVKKRLKGFVESGQLGPEVGRGLVGAVEQGAGRAPGVVLADEVADGVGEGTVVVGDGDGVVLYLAVV